jgi:hypothetical protein
MEPKNNMRNTITAVALAGSVNVVGGGSGAF